PMKGKIMFTKDAEQSVVGYLNRIQELLKEGGSNSQQIENEFLLLLNSKHYIKVLMSLTHFKNFLSFCQQWLDCLSSHESQLNNITAFYNKLFLALPLLNPQLELAYQEERFNFLMHACRLHNRLKSDQALAWLLLAFQYTDG